jgi:hypothetical protein
VAAVVDTVESLRAVLELEAQVEQAVAETLLPLTQPILAEMELPIQAAVVAGLGSLEMLLKAERVVKAVQVS